MKIRLFMALTLVLLSVSACVVEPIGGRHHYRDEDGGRHDAGHHDAGHHDEGRRDWR